MSDDLKQPQKFVPNLLDDLISELTEYIDEDTLVRQVDDGDFSYQIHEVTETNSNVSWYLAITNDGSLVGFGVSYYWVTKMAEAWLETMLEQQFLDEKQQSELYELNPLQYNSKTLN